MEKCLIMAEKDGVSSIAFPTVGCGKLGFDPKSVAHSFVQAQRNMQSTVQVVCYFIYLNIKLVLQLYCCYVMLICG